MSRWRHRETHTILDEDQILSWIMPDASPLLTAQQKHDVTRELIRKHFDPVVEDPSPRVLALQRRSHLRHWSETPSLRSFQQVK